MRTLILVVAFLLLGCNTNRDLHSGQDLDPALRAEVLKYQKSYPIPKRPDKNRKYVYFVGFYQEKQNTIMTILRSPDGIIDNVTTYGIYEDEELKPTVVVDGENLSSPLVLNKITNPKLETYKWKGEKLDRTTPIHRYLVKDGNFSFVKVDTLSADWDK